MMIGKPNPPFLIIAPKGAPIKKKMRHVSANVNLPIISMRCSRSILSPSLVIMLWKFNSLISD